MIKLDTLKLECSMLFICDTCIINFAGSSFTANVKQLTVCTPCCKTKMMGVDLRGWTRDNFAVTFPLLEQVTPGMHGIHNSTCHGVGVGLLQQWILSMLASRAVMPHLFNIPTSNHYMTSRLMLAVKIKNFEPNHAFQEIRYR
jgi:hypothetical protein